MWKTMAADPPRRVVYLEEQRGDGGPRKYRVARRINLLDPPGGKIVTHEEVRDLITDGVEVIIDPPWRSGKSADREVLR